MNEVELVGGPFDGATIETELNGPSELRFVDGDREVRYSRSGRVAGRWVFVFEAEATR